MTTLTLQKHVFFAGKWLVLCSIAGLILRRGLFKPYTLQLFEITILLAGALFLFMLVKKKNLPRIEPVWLWFLGTILLLLFLGILNSFFIFGITTSILVPSAKDFFLLITVFLGFYLTAVYGEDPSFRKKAFYAMSGALLFIPFIFFPQSAFTWGLMTDNLQFIGLHNNPTLFGLFALIPLVIFVEQTLRQKRLLVKVSYWIGAIMLYSLILWSSSRSVWLAGVLVIGFLSLYYILTVYPRHFLLKNIFSISLLLFLSFSASFLILPSSVKIMALDRIFPAISNSTANPKVFKQLSFDKALIIIQDETKTLSAAPYQNRQTIIPQAFALLLQHPYGIGPEYFRITHGIFDGNKGPTTAHNTFLQAMLSGGVLLGIVYVLFWIKIVRTLMQTPRDQEWLWLSASLIGVSFVLLFGDFLFYVPLVWILMGLVVAKGRSHAAGEHVS